MPRHHQSLAIAAIVVLLCAFAYLAVRHNEAVGRASAGTIALPDQRYVSTSYGFSFSYPPQYSLTEYTSQSVELGDMQTGTTLADATVETTDNKTPFKNFDDFVVHRAALFCDTGDSVHCPGVSRSSKFVSRAGANGTVFYLEYVDTSGGATTTREAGPFYDFNVSANVPESRYAALIIRPVHFAEESDAYDAGAALARSVADSLDITTLGQ